LHNGVAVQVARELHGQTAHRVTRGYEAHGDAPLALQSHGNPVRHRNVWIRSLAGFDQP
jgi:hypothetical protein